MAEIKLETSKEEKIVNKELQSPERKVFKWGDLEYLLDDLLKLHSLYENSYYAFAKEKGLYDDEALSGLRHAISNRINAAKEGKSFEGDGSLNTDTADNINIETRKKGLIRKAKYVAQDNTEWAKYYLNKLVGQLNPYNKKLDTTSNKNNNSTWDISKYGLTSFLTGLGINAKEIFENYDGLDADNPSAARSLTLRKELLKRHLENYKSWLSKKAFDYSKNDNEWDDNFENDLSNLLSKYDNISDTELSAALRKLGADESFITAFTSKQWATQELTQALSANQALNQTEQQWKQEENKRAEIFKLLLDRKTGQMTLYLGKDKNFDVTDEDMTHFLQNTYLNGKSQKQIMDEFDASYKNNPYDPNIALIILPIKGKQGLLKDISQGQYAGWSYDPTTIDESRLSVMAFNKETGAIEEIFLGNAADEWANIKNKYISSDSLPITQESIYATKAKKGGILYYQTGGEFSSYEFTKLFMDEKTKADAKKHGRTEEMLKSRDRIVSHGLTEEDPSLASPDAGFTAAEYTRLGTIAADITSMFLDPVSGAAVGATSSLANFGADIADDGFQLRDVGNLFVNLGFDAVGLIPVVGDALGTGSKIAKQCIKLAPKVLTGLAAYQGVKNFGGMTESWKKLISGDKEQKMTVQDWRNIAQSIGLLTGTVRGVKAHRSAKKMKQQAKVDDTVSVTIENKKTGQQEHILVAGDLATKIKEAGGSASEINKILDSIDQYKGKFGENGELTVATKMGGLQMPFGRTTKTDGSKSWGWKGFTSDGRAKVNDVYDFTQIQKQNGIGYRPFGQPDAWRQKIALRVGGTNSTAITNARKAAAQQQPNTPENKLIQYDLKVVDKYIDYMKGAMTSRSAKRKTTAEAIRSARTRVKLAEAYEQQSTKFKNDLDGINATIQHHENLRNTKYQELTDLKHRMNSPGAYTSQRIAQRDQLTAEINLLDRQIANLNQLKTLTQDALLTHLNNPQDLAAANKILDANIQKGQSLSKKNHTTAYRRLLDYLNKLNNLPDMPLGVTKYDMKAILENAGIKHAYKHGGNINKNKLNKFLNYAKG